MKNEIFVDWLTASQFHPKGGLPILSGGIIVQYDAQGLPRFERNMSASIEGSFSSSIRIGCDGYRVSLSGNVGRFSRQNNLYNFGWLGTLSAVNRILADIGFPIFTPSTGIEGTETYQRGAVVSRLDVTCNYRCSNELSARAAIVYLASKSLARMKKGHSKDESVWWANTRYMLKAYIKATEMLHHGIEEDDPAYLHAVENSILRVELELKKRTLSDLNMNDIGNITQEKLEHLYRENTSLLQSIDTSADNIVLSEIPKSSQIYASAWLAGQDIRALISKATFHRHYKTLLDYGVDISHVKNVKALPVKVRFLDLQPMVAPQWYQDEANKPKLRLVA